LNRVLPVLALLILLAGSVAGAYLVLDWWEKNKDSDSDGISDHLETSKYRTNPQKADSDGDTLNDEFEIDNESNPLTSTTIIL